MSAGAGKQCENKMMPSCKAHYKAALKWIVRVDTLYSMNNKKGDPAARSARGLESPATGPTISIENLFDIARKEAPNVF